MNDDALALLFLANIFVLIGRLMIVAVWQPPHIAICHQVIFLSALILLFMRFFATVSIDWKRDASTTIVVAIFLAANANVMRANWQAAGRPRVLP